MTTLLAPTQVILSALESRAQTPTFTLDAQTATLALRLKRPTSLVPLAWDETGRVQTNIVVMVDGVKYTCTGSATGGIRKDRDYVLRYTLPCGFFGSRSGFPKRLGQTATDKYEAWVELIHQAGAIVTEVELLGFEAPAQAVAFHSSVAFDVASSTGEETGDGAVSSTHTATGSDLAAFVLGTNTAAAGLLGSATYDGSAMTEQWDVVYEIEDGYGGYTLAGIASGAKTVTHTLASSGEDFHGIGVMTFTGVDQTSPVGDMDHAESTGAQPSLTLTAGDDDMIVDGIYARQATVTVGADQTQRDDFTEDNATTGRKQRGSTQAGSVAGDVMSWTVTDANDPWGHGAVVFTASTGAAPRRWFFGAH